MWFSNVSLHSYIVKGGLATAAISKFCIVSVSTWKDSLPQGRKLTEFISLYHIMFLLFIPIEAHCHDTLSVYNVL